MLLVKWRWHLKPLLTISSKKMPWSTNGSLPDNQVILIILRFLPSPLLHSLPYPIGHATLNLYVPTANETTIALTTASHLGGRCKVRLLKRSLSGTINHHNPLLTLQTPTSLQLLPQQLLQHLPHLTLHFLTLKQSSYMAFHTLLILPLLPLTPLMTNIVLQQLQ